MNEQHATTSLRLKSPTVELAEIAGSLVYYYTLFVRRSIDAVIEPVEGNEKEQILALRRLIREQIQQIEALGIKKEIIAVGLHHIDMLLDDVKPDIKPNTLKTTTAQNTAQKLQTFLATMKQLKNNIKDPSLHTPDNRFEMIRLQRLAEMDQKIIIGQELMTKKDFLEATTHLNATIDYDITAHAS